MISFFRCTLFSSILKRKLITCERRKKKKNVDTRKGSRIRILELCGTWCRNWQDDLHTHIYAVISMNFHDILERIDVDSNYECNSSVSVYHSWIWLWLGWLYVCVCVPYRFGAPFILLLSTQNYFTFLFRCEHFKCLLATMTTTNI